MHSGRRQTSAADTRVLCGWRTLALLCTVMMLVSIGCQRQQTPQRRQAKLKPASLQTRAQRRAFSGAPPVIPHVSFGLACVTCHQAEGKEVPTVGLAPANPHLGDRRAGALTNCKQCHVFANTKSQFVDNSFVGLTEVTANAERAFPGAPPVIPHSTNMRANCNACHAGVSARPEIKCTHPERSNCVQCHVAGDEQIDAEQVFAVQLPQTGGESTVPTDEPSK